MSPTENRQQQFPIRPLFRQSANEAPSPVDRPQHIAGAAERAPRYKSTTSSSRIEKHAASSRMRRGRAGPNLDQQFAESLEDSRREIRQAADEVLTEVEGNANADLARVVEEVEEKLQLALDYEIRAFKSIADERLLITKLSPEKMVMNKEEVILRERMQVFMQILGEEENALDILWQEWTTIQTEMACLAFEVLGPDEVSIGDGDAVVLTPENVHKAIQRYKTHQDAFKDALDGLAALQNSINKATSRTLSIVKDQQQESFAANKATMKAMAKMLEELNP